MHTGHQISKVAERLSEDHVTVLGDALLQFLLQVAAAMLVLAQGRDLALEVLQPRSREPID